MISSAKLARYMIQVEFEFDFVAVARQSDDIEENESWPSWVADGTRARRDILFHAFVPQRVLNIGGNVRTAPEFAPDGKTLRFSGKALEAIVALNQTTIDERSALIARHDLMNGQPFRRVTREWFITTLRFVCPLNAEAEQLMQMKRYVPALGSPVIELCVTRDHLSLLSPPM